MTEPLAITGTYADFKLVKTRSMAQMVVEVPIERAQEIVTAFGLPQPGAEIHVAVARLNAGSSKGKAPGFEPGNAGSSPAPAAREHWNEMKLAKQAGIRCGELEFQEWLFERAYGQSEPPALVAQAGWFVVAAVLVRTICDVDSRAELDTNPEAGKRWLALDLEYQQVTGKAARDG